MRIEFAGKKGPTAVEIDTTGIQTGLMVSALAGIFCIFVYKLNKLCFSDSNASRGPDDSGGSDASQDTENDGDADN